MEDSGKTPDVVLLEVTGVLEHFLNSNQNTQLQMRISSQPYVQPSGIKEQAASLQPVVDPPRESADHEDSSKPRKNKVASSAYASGTHTHTHTHTYTSTLL